MILFISIDEEKEYQFRLTQVNSDLNNKVSGSLYSLTSIRVGRTEDRVFIRFYVSLSLCYQIEFIDSGVIGFLKGIINGSSESWTTLWIK